MILYSNNGKYLATSADNIPTGKDFTVEEDTKEYFSGNFITSLCLVMCSLCIILSLSILHSINSSNNKFIPEANAIAVITEPEEDTKPPHIHQYKEIIIPATCTYGGYTVHECTCGNSYIDNKTNPIPHEYVWEITAEPDYWQDGEKVGTCCECGETITESIPKLDYPVLNYTNNLSTEPEDRFFGYTEEDFMYLLRTLVGECHGCPEEDQFATGSVILNRLNNKKYWSYKNIKDVVYRTDQYSCWATTLVNREPTQRNIDVALKLLKDGPTIPENCIFQAGFPQGDGIYKVYSSGIMICYKD